MSDLVERCAAAEAAVDGRTLMGMSRSERERYYERARAVLALAVEECARVADNLNGWGADCGRGGHADHIAAAIRSLSDKEGK